MSTPKVRTQAIRRRVEVEATLGLRGDGGVLLTHGIAQRVDVATRHGAGGARHGRGGGGSLVGVVGHVSNPSPAGAGAARHRQRLTARRSYHYSNDH